MVKCWDIIIFFFFWFNFKKLIVNIWFINDFKLFFVRRWECGIKFCKDCIFIVILFLLVLIIWIWKDWLFVFNLVNFFYIWLIFSCLIERSILLFVFCLWIIRNFFFCWSGSVLDKFFIFFKEVFGKGKRVKDFFFILM